MCEGARTWRRMLTPYEPPTMNAKNGMPRCRSG